MPNLLDSHRPARGSARRPGGGRPGLIVLDRCRRHQPTKSPDPLARVPARPPSYIVVTVALQVSAGPTTYSLDGGCSNHRSRGNGGIDGPGQGPSLDWGHEVALRGTPGPTPVVLIVGSIRSISGTSRCPGRRTLKNRPANYLDAHPREKIRQMPIFRVTSGLHWETIQPYLSAVLTVTYTTRRQSWQSVSGSNPNPIR